MPMIWKCEVVVSYIYKVKINLVYSGNTFQLKFIPGKLPVEKCNLNCKQRLQQHNFYKYFCIRRDIASTQYVLSSTHWRLPDLCIVNTKHKNQYKRNKRYSCAKTYLSFLKGHSRSFQKLWKKRGRIQAQILVYIAVKLGIPLWFHCKVKGCSSFKKKYLLCTFL